MYLYDHTGRRSNNIYCSKAKKKREQEIIFIAIHLYKDQYWLFNFQQKTTKKGPGGKGHRLSTDD